MLLSILIISFTFLPNNNEPTFELYEILLFKGSTSLGPTILYSSNSKSYLIETMLPIETKLLSLLFDGYILEFSTPLTLLS